MSAAGDLEEMDEQSLTLLRSIPSPLPNIKCQDLLRHQTRCKKSGWLRQERVGAGAKIASLFGSSQKYVVVHMGCIYVYKSESDSKAEKAVSLFGFSQIIRTASTMKDLPWAFTLIYSLDAKQKRFTFVATNEMDMKQWMQCLKGEMLRANSISVDNSDTGSDYTDLETPLSAPSDYLATVRRSRNMRARLGSLSGTDDIYSDAGNTRDSGFDSMASNVSCSNFSQSPNGGNIPQSQNRFSAPSQRPLPRLPNHPPSSPESKRGTPDLKPPQGLQPPQKHWQRPKPPPSPPVTVVQPGRHPHKDRDVQDWVDRNPECESPPSSLNQPWQLHDQTRQERQVNKPAANFLRSRPLPDTPVEAPAEVLKPRLPGAPRTPPTAVRAPKPPPSLPLDDPRDKMKKEIEQKWSKPSDRSLPLQSSPVSKSLPSIPQKIKKLPSPAACFNDESRNTSSSNDTSSSAASSEKPNNLMSQMGAELSKMMLARRKRCESEENIEQESYEEPINLKKSPADPVRDAGNCGKTENNTFGHTPVIGTASTPNPNKFGAVRAAVPCPPSPPKNSPPKNSPPKKWAGWGKKNQFPTPQPPTNFAAGGSASDAESFDDPSEDYENIEDDPVSDMDCNGSGSGSSGTRGNYLKPSRQWTSPAMLNGGNVNTVEISKGKTSPPTPFKHSASKPQPAMSSSSNKPSVTPGVPAGQKWKASPVQQSVTSRGMTGNESTVTGTQAIGGGVKAPWKNPEKAPATPSKAAGWGNSAANRNQEQPERPADNRGGPALPVKSKQLGKAKTLERWCESETGTEVQPNQGGIFGPRVGKPPPNTSAGSKDKALGKSGGSDSSKENLGQGPDNENQEVRKSVSQMKERFKFS